MRRDMIILGFLAIVIYLPCFWWGTPSVTQSAPNQTRSWGTDDMSPLGPLADIYDIIRPQVDRYLGYPLVHSFVVVSAFTPYLGYLLLTGNISIISNVYPFGLVDPNGTLKILTYIAHFLSVIMGAGIVLAAYYTGSTLWGRRVGLFSGILIFGIFPLYYYARTGNVDVPMLFYLSWMLAVLAPCIQSGLNSRRAIWIGILGGLALGTKDQALAALVVIPFFLIYLRWKDQKSGDWKKWVFWKPIILGLIAFTFAYGFGSGLFVSPERYFAHIAYHQQKLNELQAGSILYMKYFPNTISGNIQLVQDIFMYLVDSISFFGIILSGFGIFLVIQKFRKGIIFLTIASIYLGFLFISFRSPQLRYMLPVVYVLVLFMAIAFDQTLKFRNPILRAAGVLFIAGYLLLGVLRGIDLTYVMMNDSRYLAAEWLKQHAKIGDQVEHFGIPWSLPPIKEGITIHASLPYYGGSQPLRNDEQAVNEVIQGWKERRPEFLIILPDYISTPGLPYSGACPAKICEGLMGGSLDYKLEAFFETPALFPWIHRPELDYPNVNPPIRIYVPNQDDVPVGAAR